MTNCYADVGEWMDGMTGKKLAARPMRSGHRAFAAGCSTSSTEGVRRRLDVETRRFLFDDGRLLPQRPIPGKSQGHRRVEGSHMTLGSGESSSKRSWTVQFAVIWGAYRKQHPIVNANALDPVSGD